MRCQWQWCGRGDGGPGGVAYLHALSPRKRHASRRRNAVWTQQGHRYWQHVRIRRGLGCSSLRAAMLLATGLSAATAHAGMPAFPLLSSAQVYWSKPESAQVWGMPLHYARFVTHWPLEKMAAELSHDKQRFQVFNHLPGRLMLSGHSEGQHWVAQLIPDGTGSRGLVSVWEMPLEGRARSDRGVLAGLFQPQGVWRSLLHVRRRVDGKAVEQAVYQGAELGMLSELSARLKRAGWEPEQTLVSPETKWRRAGQRLYWRQRSVRGASMLFVHYSEQE